MRARGAAALLLILPCGCTVGPDFKRPEPPRLASWRNTVANDRSVDPMTDPDPRWWARFGDPVLTELMQTAIRQNLDVQQAVLRVIESRQNIVTAAAVGLPSLNGNATYLRDQLGARGLLESEGVYQGLDELANRAQQVGGPVGKSASQFSPDTLLNPITQPVNLYTLTLSASWELDLFGRVRRSVEQVRAQTQAQAESANDALVSLESEVAQAYVQLRGAQALRASQEENIASARGSLDLTESRSETGLSTALDVDQARTQLLTLERQLPEYEKQEKQAVDRLNLLIAQPPGTLDAMLLHPGPLPALPDAVGIGLPSTLARRRPDIRGAEAQLHAATASVGVAVANFYPDVALTGNLGVRATDVTYVTNWASHYYSVGPSISLPIFEGGRLTAALRLARAQAAEAALRYKSTVLNALREMEDALVSFRADRIERDRIAGVLRSGEDTLALATNSYAHGLSTYLQVLDAQRTVEDSRQQLTQQAMTLANDVVTLYRASGGGWQRERVPAPVIDKAPPLSTAAPDALAAH